MISPDNVNAAYKKLKHKAASHFEAGCLNKALQFVQSAAELMYSYNLIYTDAELEGIIKGIEEKVIKRTEYEPKVGKIFFYDYWSLDTRGLALIYLEALIENNLEIVYVCRSSNHNNKMRKTEKILTNYAKAKIIEIDDLKDYLSQIRQLNDVVRRERPEKVLLQIYPSDVVPLTVFAAYAGKIERFNINLTDHGFWLGASVFDYNIEFRDYGYLVSRDYRDINDSKLIILPYYPRPSVGEFHGFTFPTNGKKLIVSGGSIYKIAGSPVFTQIVEHILSNYDDTLFLFLSNGESEELRFLEKKFEGRCFLQPERDDLDEVMKRSYFYLNTFPILGGLMTQYAVSNSKVPVSFDDKPRKCGVASFGDINSLLINADSKNISCPNQERLYVEISRLLRDEEYYTNRCADMKGLVITPEMFALELKECLFMHRTIFKCNAREVDINGFSNIYLSASNQQELKKWLFKRQIVNELPIPVIRMLKSVKKMLSNGK